MCAASLIKTGEKISDVCEKTGFNDQHYFSQLFKKTFGCTPSNYRNENGENFPGLYEIPVSYPHLCLLFMSVREKIIWIFFMRKIRFFMRSFH